MIKIVAGVALGVVLGGLALNWWEERDEKAHPGGLREAAYDWCEKNDDSFSRYDAADRVSCVMRYTNP